MPARRIDRDREIGGEGGLTVAAEPPTSRERAERRFDEAILGWATDAPASLRRRLPRLRELYGALARARGSDDPRRRETLRVIGVVAESRE